MAVQARDIEVADGAHAVKLYEEEAELVAAASAQTGIGAQFGPYADAPGRARRLVVAAVRGWGAPDALVNDLALLVSELATNAVRHADSSFSVTLRAVGPTLRVGVHDGAPLAGAVPPAWLVPQPLHGLALVDALCTRWGVEDSGHGKLVWAELPYASAAVAEARD
jgi:serine/threonine-protein kinase RsbW